MRKDLLDSLITLISTFDGDIPFEAIAPAKQALDEVIGILNKASLGGTVTSSASKGSDKVAQLVGSSASPIEALATTGAAFSIVGGVAGIVANGLGIIRNFGAINETKQIKELLAPQLEQMRRIISIDADRLGMGSIPTDIQPILDADEKTVIDYANDAVAHPEKYNNHLIAAIMGKLHPTTGEDPNASFTVKARTFRRELFSPPLHKDSPSLLVRLSDILANRLDEDMVFSEGQSGMVGMAEADSRSLLANKILQLASLRRISDSNIDQLKGEYMRFIGSCVGLSLGGIATSLAAAATAGVAIPTAAGLAIGGGSLGKTVVGLFVSDAHRLPGVSRVAERADISAVSTDISGGMPYLKSQQIIEERLLELTARLTKVQNVLTTLDFANEEEKNLYMSHSQALYESLITIPGTLYKDSLEDPMNSIRILGTLDILDGQLKHLEAPLAHLLPQDYDESPVTATEEISEEKKAEIREVLDWYRKSYESKFKNKGSLILRQEEVPKHTKAIDKSFVPGRFLASILHTLTEDQINKKLFEIMRVYSAHKLANGSGVRADIKPHLKILKDAAYGVISVTNIADLVALEKAMDAGHKFLKSNSGESLFATTTIEQKYTDPKLASRYPRHKPDAYFEVADGAGLVPELPTFGGGAGGAPRPRFCDAGVSPAVSYAIPYPPPYPPHPHYSAQGAGVDLAQEAPEYHGDFGGYRHHPRPY